MQDNDNTSNPFSKEIYDDWVDVYGSPDPIFFPGLPYNFLTSKLLADKSYYFLISPNVVGVDDE